MVFVKSSLYSVALLFVASAVNAASPASGTLSESESLSWTGDAPFVVTNVTPASGMPQCVAEPAACDVFELTVAVSERFRKDEKNKRSSARFIVSWPNPSGAGDFDVYLRTADGSLVADAATSANPEAITVPVAALKDGGYRFEVIPFAPLGDNYEATAEVSNPKSGSVKSFSIEPAVAASGETVTFDARSLASAPPAGGYRFSFGDGSPAYTSSNGLAEHIYAGDGNYLARVSFTDPNGRRGTVTSAQTVVVNSSLAAAGSLIGKSGDGLLLGAFGFPALFSLFGLALLRRRFV